MKAKRMNGNERFIPNSFQTPNAYVDDLMYLLTSSEWKVLSYTVRRIFGFQKRADRISLSQYTEGTFSRETGEYFDHGTGLSTSTVIKALDDLVRFGIMEVVSENNPKINNGREYALTTSPSTINFFALNSRALDSAKSNAEKIEPARKARFDKQSAPPPTDTPLPLEPTETQYTVENQRNSECVSPEKPRYADSEESPESSPPEELTYEECGPDGEPLQAKASRPKWQIPEDHPILKRAMAVTGRKWFKDHNEKAAWKSVKGGLSAHLISDAWVENCLGFAGKKQPPISLYSLLAWMANSEKQRDWEVKQGQPTIPRAGNIDRQTWQDPTIRPIVGADGKEYLSF